MGWGEAFWGLIAILVFGSVAKYVLGFNVRQLRSQAKGRLQDLPPGTTGWPILGESFEYNKAFRTENPFIFYKERCTKWGEIFLTHMFGSPLVSIMSPELVKQVLSQEHSLFGTSYPSYTKRLLGPYSLIHLQGDTHKRMRRLMQPFLQPDKLKGFMGTIESLIKTNLERCEQKGDFLVYDLCRQTAFDIINKMMMSRDRGPESAEMLEDFDIWRLGMKRFPINLPGSAFNAALKARARIGTAIEKLCADRTRNGKVGAHGDLVDTLLTEHKEVGGPPLSTQQVADLVFVTLIAGLDTSATTMAFSMMFLLQYPEVLDELRREHHDLRQKVGPNTPLSWLDFKSLQYTQKVIDETLRLANPASSVFRAPLRDTKLQGYFIPAGMRVQLSILGVHRNPDNYTDPHKFDPNRWQAQRQPGAGVSFLPFGYGARSCMGMDLARMEIALFLHHLVANYKWQETTPFSISYFPLPRFTDGFPARLTRLH